MACPIPSTDPGAFSLYLHIPFCRMKCPYCDFYSVPIGNGAQLAAYPELLNLEMQRANSAWQGPITSLFFGGGTPSLLPVSDIAQLITAARQHFGFADGIEITLEANPGTVTAAYLTGLRRAGVNRLSLGVQALSDPALAALGRIHSHQETLDAVQAARTAGFDNLSLDLIYGRPGQERTELEAELEQLLDLKPQHLSCYTLSIETGTPFAQQHAIGDLVLPLEETVAAAFLSVHNRLEHAGFGHYEISNFARPGFECRHNLGYWQRRPYLGLGAGAHSLRMRQWGDRLAVPNDLERYAAHLASGERTAEVLEVCDQRLAMAETLYLGLRTRTGVSDADFSTRFGTTVAEAFPDAIQRCGSALHHEEDHWRFDLSGWLIYDHLIAHFL